MPTHWRNAIGAFLMVAAAYFAAGKLGLGLAMIHPNASAIWPPTAIALCAMLILGDRVWPAVYLGAFLVNITTAGSVLTSLAIAAGNTLEAASGAYLVRRFAAGIHALDHPQEIFKFALLAGLGSTLVSATIGASSLSAAGYLPWANFGSVWLTWWTGDSVSNLILSPLILIWYSRKPAERTLDHIIEVILLYSALFFVGQIAFSGLLEGNYPLQFLCPPILIWCAFRFSRFECSIAMTFLALLAIWHTLNGSGAFARGDINESLLLLQVFLGVTSVTTLVIAALVEDRRQNALELWRAHSELEEQVQQRTADLTRAVDIAAGEISERKQREAELNLIHRLTGAIQETETLESALAITLRKVCETTRWTLGQAWVPDSARNSVRCITSWLTEKSPDIENFMRVSESKVMKLGEGIPGIVWATQKPLWSRDIHEDVIANYPRLPYAKKAGLKAAVGVPILVHNEVIAILEFFVSGTREPDSRMTELINTVAGQLGASIERKRVEEQLRKQSKILQSILDNMAEGILMVDDSGALILKNSAAGRILDMNPKISPHHWMRDFELFLPDGNTGLSLDHDPINRALKGDHVDEFEMAVKNMHTGKLVQITSTARPIRDENGHIRAAVSVIRDITERRRISRALRESEELSRLLIDSVRDYAIYMLDTEGRVISWNDGAQRIIGYEASEIIGKPMSSFYPPEDVLAGKPARIMDQARALGHVEEEGIRLRKDGSQFIASVTLTAVKDENGNHIGFSKVTRDITERKRNEDTIQLYANIVWNAQIGLAVLKLENDDAGTLKLLAVNPGAEESVGMPLRQHIGQNLREFAPALYDTGYAQMFAEVVRTGKPMEVPEIVSTERVRGIFAAKIFPLPNRNVGVAFENITDRKRKEEALKRLDQLKAEIDQRRSLDAIKDEFISTVSHELRTPLTIVEGAIDNLRDGLAGPLHGKQKQVVSMAHRNVHRLAKMINNLLDLSRLESGKAKISRTTVDLRPLAKDIVQGLSAQAAKNKIVIRLEMPQDMPLINADTDMIGQVITNLLDNAIRYASSEVLLKSRRIGRHLQITISDDGSGIPQDKIGELFNKFVQVNRVSGDGYKGTGLGLAICREIIALHQGKIWVESKPDQGTQFHFTLPESSTSAKPAASRANQRPVS